MGVGVGHRVSEPELEVGTAQVRLTVVLDEGIDAGEHEVVSQVVLQGPALHGGADPAVLNPVGPPAGRETISVPKSGQLTLSAPCVSENTGQGQNCSQGSQEVDTRCDHTGIPLLVQQARGFSTS